MPNQTEPNPTETKFVVDPALLATVPKTIKTADDADAAFAVMAKLTAGQREFEGKQQKRINAAKDAYNPQITAFHDAFVDLQARVAKFGEKQRDKKTGKTIFGDKKSWKGRFGEIKLQARPAQVQPIEGTDTASVIKALQRRKLMQCVTVPKPVEPKLNISECRKLDTEVLEAVGLELVTPVANVHVVPDLHAIQDAKPATLVG